MYRIQQLVLLPKSTTRGTSKAANTVREFVLGEEKHDLYSLPTACSSWDTEEQATGECVSE